MNVPPSSSSIIKSLFLLSYLSPTSKISSPNFLHLLDKRYLSSVNVTLEYKVLKKVIFVFFDFIL